MKKNKKMPPKDAIQQALLKKALGYDCDEVVEEYSKNEDGELVLIKKKVTKKHISPDIPAAKMLLCDLSETKNNYENMTDEELQNEKKRLISLLRKGEENANK